MTGNPRCQSPAFLREIPLQDVAAPDFRCEDGTPHRSPHAQHTTKFIGSKAGHSAGLVPLPVLRHLLTSCLRVSRLHARGRQLLYGAAVSQPVHVHGLGGPLQQQAPAGAAQGSAPQRHRAVSVVASPWKLCHQNKHSNVEYWSVDKGLININIINSDIISFT